jgi:hypothetical protein
MRLMRSDRPAMTEIKRSWMMGARGVKLNNCEERTRKIA